MVNKKSVGLNVSTVQTIKSFLFGLYQLVFWRFETETCVVVHVAAVQRTLADCSFCMQPTRLKMDIWTNNGLLAVDYNIKVI